MEDTIIYLIRHAETVKENGIRNTNEAKNLIVSNLERGYIK